MHFYSIYNVISMLRKLHFNRTLMLIYKVVFYKMIFVHRNIRELPFTVLYWVIIHTNCKELKELSFNAVTGHPPTHTLRSLELLD